MIRNFIYSLCLHILIIIIFSFSSSFDLFLNTDKSLNNGPINVDKNFLNRNYIKTNDNDLYSSLSLNNKIKLYEFLKNSEVSKSYSNSLIDYVKNKDNNDYNEYILYLGPTDYEKYLEKYEYFNNEEVIQNTTNFNVSINKKNSLNESSNENILNIDLDKIFTKNDIKQIKESIKNKNNKFSLSIREKINIQNQLISCYKNALFQTSMPSKVPVSVTVKLFSNGVIDTRKIFVRVIDDENKFTEKDYNDAIKNAKISLVYCNPIKNLPSSKYIDWQKINFIFDATNY